MPQLTECLVSMNLQSTVSTQAVFEAIHSSIHPSIHPSIHGLNARWCQPRVSHTVSIQFLIAPECLLSARPSGTILWCHRDILYWVFLGFQIHLPCQIRIVLSSFEVVVGEILSFRSFSSLMYCWYLKRLLSYLYQSWLSQLCSSTFLYLPVFELQWQLSLN